MSRTRRATHAGSWYSSQGDELNQQLRNWLVSANSSSGGHPRAIIAPHAGYYYCGACGGHAYKQIDSTKVRRIFILGPSHHVKLPGCALSQNDRYQTPFYDLMIDAEIYNELIGTGVFEWMNRQDDEDEHSIEMHLPYIAKVMEGQQGRFSIVPILVGSLCPKKEQTYGDIFSRYLADPSNLFVISSDFCHWGSRFSYTYHDKSFGEIWQSIEHLDRMGMDIIESMDPGAFTKYLAKFHNTICGRHPIGVLLNAISALQQNGNGHKFKLKFLQYAQSSHCRKMTDSSVSYAAAALTIQ